MARTVAIGVQNFEKIITNNRFYIDKTLFIKDWWDSGDEVTLITRPRRFGKTLNMNMLERFFGLEYQGQGAVWSLLFASGYLKVKEIQGNIYKLELTKYEVLNMFETMVHGWFGKNSADYNDFIKALLRDDIEEMKK